MKMYNEEGVEINVDKAQMETMLDAGWTREKPEVHEKEASTEETEETEDSSAPKKIKKTIKKTIKK